MLPVARQEARTQHAHLAESEKEQEDNGNLRSRSAEVNRLRNAAIRHVGIVGWRLTTRTALEWYIGGGTGAAHDGLPLRLCGWDVDMTASCAVHDGQNQRVTDCQGQGAAC